MSTEPECRLVRAETTYDGKQGLTYRRGIAAETVGSTGICMHLLTVPPGGRAKVHLHEKHETAIYVLEGEAWTLHGELLQHQTLTRAGDLLYIPAGVPHLPVNLSDKPISAVIARTDASEQESVVLLPDLEPLAEEIIAALKSGDLKPELKAPPLV
ncbi:cupin domain-containing protein [Rhodomicrobium sp. Az07]|uniref:cupin domain-containing protein n=1 Tax=Rhodomicrobium sp. Az07 TaxID=2839034 RepID=UPI001BE83B67|nr:cupin domain-containing protein [Rhodomicrobium sp. Az07]MBT3070035.1 cupin domain-containing protein [Rhodomicrobium sp. Az07]